MSELARVSGLVIGPASGGAPTVDGVGFTLDSGEVLGLMGRSGSGKTTTALTLLGHIRPGLRLREGSVRVAGLDPFAPADVRRLRGRVVSFLGQDPAAALNPARRIGGQIREAVRLRAASAGPDQVDRLLDAVRLPAGRDFLRRFPHQISGGQARRVAFAIALAGAPELLILDEPTAGLDTVLARETRDLLRELAEGRGVVLVSHDEHLVRALAADRVLVLDAGRPVSAPPRAARVTPSPPPGPPSEGPAALRAERLSAAHDRRPVLREVSLAVGRGECVAVVGPSGSGKTTLARCLVGLHRPAGGEISLEGTRLAPDVRRRTPDQRRAVQLVAQDSMGALNPRETVTAALTRPLRARGLPRTRVPGLVAELLGRVHLPASLADRRPPALSGGERQRVNLARALACAPRVLVCDEVTSALDAEIGEAVLGLLDELRRDLGLGVVLITHDLAAVARSASRVLVVHEGEIVERGPTASVLSGPRHHVTRMLVEHAADQGFGAPAP
ncbi:peptide/nickel transport system ATP-binding protein [Thermocatellispora tengchongensis]|uniref:Peptide/nickel transport system ATP-binding protein n=1 Tax=Thermocatellispora tengchongensis TaxID=1073253 RepID=A0A840P713_9ACTN|nr:ATP-binding cassette domain-containing protein [Thermocatellispora tengchongensis]MBB5135458.1 peptide/nickel transport system ATP-binding protein [Thermocatellispora tengchongensis]